MSAAASGRSEEDEPKGAGSACPACGSGRIRRARHDRSLGLRRCATCRSAWLDRPPSEDDLRRRYEREHAAGKWGEIFRAAPATEATWRLDLLDELGGAGRILDVGCGDGTFLAAARERGWKGVGVEISFEAASSARARTPPLPVVVGGAGCVSPEAGFDVATWWDVLEHVPDPLDLLLEGVRRVRRDGLAAATMPNVHGTTAWLHGKAWTYYDLGAYGHLVHFSLRGLAALFERAGLEVVHAATRGSTDLRYLPEVWWGRETSGVGAAVLDRLSGFLARVAEPAGWGNTLVVVGRRP